MHCKEDNVLNEKEVAEARNARVQEQDSDDDDDFSEDTLKDKYLAFCIGEEEYCIEIRYITEIVGIQHIAQVPDMPDFVKGVINLRGRVIPVMDVRLRFKMAAREYDERTCVVVATVGESLVGFVVDTVREVCSIPEVDISDAPGMSRAESTRYIRGIARVGEGVKIIIDIEKLMLDDESRTEQTVN
jgi:purine-binding chemotaxis protein CheW